MIVPRIPRAKLKYVLEQYKGARHAKNERELQLHVAGFLDGQFTPANVSFEIPVGSTRVDLTLGTGATVERQAIELKIGTTNEQLDDLTGKMRRYREEFGDLILCIARPGYSEQRRVPFVREMTNISVPVIEWRD